MAKVKHVLNVADRAPNGSAEARRVRGQGLIPAVVYGKGIEPKHITVNAAEWEALAKYEFNLVSLVNGEKETLALLKETQHNFIKGQVSHIDFLEVRKDQEITAVVPVHAGHVPPVGLSQGGELEQLIYEIEVACLPDALPEFIEADLASLTVGQRLTVADMKMPEGVKAKSKGEIVVFEVIDPSTLKDDIPETAAAPAEGAAAAEPEVVGAKEKAEKAAEREEAKKK